MSKQVLSIEQMKHLQELGLDLGNTMFCWRRRAVNSMGREVNGAWALSINQPMIVQNFASYEQISAFTLQDILDLLPEEILKGERIYQLVIERTEGRYFISYYWCDNLLVSIDNELLIDAAYEMLCWCIENGYVETSGLDKLDGSKKEKEQ